MSHPGAVVRLPFLIVRRQKHAPRRCRMRGGTPRLSRIIHIASTLGAKPWRTRYIHSEVSKSSSCAVGLLRRHTCGTKRNRPTECMQPNQRFTGMVGDPRSPTIILPNSMVLFGGRGWDQVPICPIIAWPLPAWQLPMRQGRAAGARRVQSEVLQLDPDRPCQTHRRDDRDGVQARPCAPGPAPKPAGRRAVGLSGGQDGARRIHPRRRAA